MRILRGNYDQDHRLPALLLGEGSEAYSDKYGKYINPADPAKYKHIQGLLLIIITILLVTVKKTFINGGGGTAFKFEHGHSQGFLII